MTGLRDMDGQNPVERPERVEALLEVAQNFAGSDFPLGRFMFFSNFLAETVIQLLRKLASYFSGC